MAAALLAMTFLTFMMVQVIPGDPARTAAGRYATPEQVEEARKRLRLDRPILEQYGDYLWNLAHADLGQSLWTKQPIVRDLAQTLPPSLELVLLASFINTVIAVPLGVFAAVRTGGVIDGLSRVTVMALAGIPVFWLALILQLVVSAQFDLFPLTGNIGVGVMPPDRITGMLVLDSLLTGNWPALASSFHHLILPAVVLAAPEITIVTRLLRSSMLAELKKDYITFARAKGLSERRVIFRHALPNALIPALTATGMQIGWMLAATVLVESIFARVGIGAYAVFSVLESDVQAIVAVVLVVATVFVFVNFLVDLLYFWLNPKLRVANS